ncbi:MAG TPA: NAD-dependent epimerase/dehydratase family protein [Cyclobacteriaceae bacterium]|jgi:uncharacterized protein YbjT (DUF2867 family)|nr:NAD-dependent epimerase/dehydratase family protein [Cyclobacteriaceae bacterium]
MSQSKIRVIVTGATGMVGEGVLHVCLESPDVEQVLIINRRSAGVTHPKLKEIVCRDFFNLTAVENQLSNVDACFFCLGVSSVGMKEEEYYKLTYALTTTFAKALATQSPNATFCYVSGASTDSTEKGKSMWARVKGKTENDLMKIFKNAYNFRPGVMVPIEGMKNTLGFYKYLGWMIPIIRAISPKLVCHLEDVGKAMINAAIKKYEKQVLEVPDIVALSKR